MNDIQLLQQPGVTGALPRLQGRPLRSRHVAHIVASMNLVSSRMALAMPALLCCCLIAARPSFAQSTINPVDALHNAEGGAIAQPRPAMPQANAPYPNLSTVPAAPPPPDQAARAKLAQKLVADRANAQYETKVDPVLPAAPRPTPIATTGADDSLGASLSAAKAQPPVQRPAPVKPAAGAKPAQTIPANPAVATSAVPVASLPAMSSAPPPPVGFSSAPAVTAPTPPPATPPATASADAPTGASTVQSAVNSAFVRIGFAPGSDMLTGDDLAILKVFARTRGIHSIEVTGFGDVDSADAKAQAAGLELALGRARAVASYLTNVGVPPSALRIGAEAQGSGASAQLTE